jgi:hypothetical protein
MVRTQGSPSLALGLTLIAAPQLGEYSRLVSWLPLDRHRVIEKVYQVIKAGNTNNMNRRPKHFLVALFITFAALACVHPTKAQDNCLSSDDIMKMQAQIKSAPNVSFNKKLHDDLVKLV